MALQSSGAISLANIATEFGGSTPHSLSEYYGVATGVPSSGTISFDDFYGTSSVVTVTRSSSGTNIILSSEFGTNWAADIAKVYNINSGVTLGGVGQEALQVSAGMGGSLTINNAGEIQGSHGAGGSGGSGTYYPSSGPQNAGNGAAGGAGGIAIYVHSGANPTINNTGAIRGGGGGGGGGGGRVRFFAFGSYPIQGASGGSGGSGQGYNQSNSNGSGGSSSFGGSSGSGGNGGTWGVAGGSGGNGSTPSYADSQNHHGNDGTGGAGGAAGAAIAGSSRTLSNSGTVNGST